MTFQAAQRIEVTLSPAEAARIAAELHEGRLADEYLFRNWPRLLDQHRGQWVAVSSDGVELVAPDIRALKVRIEEAGLDASRLSWEFASEQHYRLTHA